jgi:predicted rRNA methylase YqxC with S4 and FtsJ domains
MAGGVVLDTNVHEQIVDRAKQWLQSQSDWNWHGTVESPIRGLESGNKEFLMYGVKSKQENSEL